MVARIVAGTEDEHHLHCALNHLCQLPWPLDQIEQMLMILQMSSNSKSIFTKVTINNKGLFIPKSHIETASKVGCKSGSSNTSTESDILKFNHLVHGLITTTKKRIIIPDSPAPSFTLVVPSTPNSVKSAQELLEDEKFIDDQLTHFAVEQRKIELQFQSYRDQKMEMVRKHALEDAMNQMTKSNMQL